jgi:hypothetical protein
MNRATPSRWPIWLVVLFGMALAVFWNGIAKGMAGIGTGEVVLRSGEHG